MQASVYLPGDTDRHLADLDATPEGLHARLRSGATVTARWSELAATLGGTDDQMVFLRAQDGRCFCVDAGHLPLLRAAAGRSHEVLLAHLQRRAGGVGLRFQLFLAACAAVVVLVLGGAVLAIPWAAEGAVASLPLSVDREIGDAGFGSMELGGTKIANPVVDGAMRTIVERLAVHAEPAGFDYRIQVVEADQVNAFALPGGQIVVYTGLLRKATRVEQVAGVLAHEMAHVTCRHGLQAVAKNLGVMIGLQVLLGDASGLAGLAGQGAMTAIINGYSREAEREADAEGLRMLIAAGMDPQGMPEFFGLLKGEAGNEAPGALAWLSTHPDHDERIANLQAQIAATTLPPPQPLGIDWAAVQAAVARP